MIDEELELIPDDDPDFQEIEKLTKKLKELEEDES